MLLDKLGGWHCIDRVRKVVCIYYNRILANQILRKAERLHFTWIDIGKWSSVERISEDNLRGSIN